MKIRRYYPKGSKQEKTYNDEYIASLEEKGVDTSVFDNAKTEIILSRSEQEAMWVQCTTMVLDNPRWVLDNLDRLCEFKVNWEDYSSKEAKERRKAKRAVALLQDWNHPALKEEFREGMTGKNNHNWKGGTRSANKIIRESQEYKDWRANVYERDNYSCQKCGKKSEGDLHAHHIKGFSDFPELRFDADNGLTVCLDCHSIIHGRPVGFKKPKGL